MPPSWHWQERFDAVDPAEACRLQVLKIQKQIPYAKWLKEKKFQNQSSASCSVSDSNSEETDAKKIECEQRFLEWVRLKQRQKTSKHAEVGSDKKNNNKNEQPFVKPPSLHVNPRTKSKKSNEPSSKRVASVAKANKDKHVPGDQKAAALSEWGRRKKCEDRTKRKHEQLNRQLQEHAQRILHLTRWKRKDVVCAYSTNHRSSTPFS